MTTDLHEALKAKRPEYESHAAFARAIRDAGYDMGTSTVKDWLAAPVGEKRYREKDGDRALMAWLEREETSNEETYRQDGDTLTAHKIIGERVTSLEEAISFFDVDTDKWRTDKWECTTYETPMKRKRGEGVEETMQVVNYRVWVRWERAYQRENLRAYADGILDEIEDNLPNVHVEEASRGEKDLAGLLSLPDVHIGKYVWSKEAGESYDLATAEALYRRAIDSLLSKISVNDLDRIYLPIGNDAAHVDGIGKSTTSGTLQDTDGLWHHIARVVARCNRYGIERAKEVAPVTAVTVRGNHDSADSVYQGMILEAAYEGDERVEVKNGPEHRRVEEFGDVMLMFDHGKEMRLADLPMQMASRFPDVWGRTRWREIHTGHKHIRTKETVGNYQELDGVIVRISPALCSADAWHAKKGYTSALRGAEAFLYHRKAGYAGNIPFNVLPEHSSDV